MAAAPLAAAELSYTDAQASAGKQAYEAKCASCHGRSLQGSHLAPALVGSRFDVAYRGKSADLLAFHVGRMPPAGTNDPETGAQITLSEAEATGVVAYLLQANGIEAGDAALPSGQEALATFDVPTKPGAAAEPDAPVEPSRRQAVRLANLSPVTAAMLENPPPGEWLRWGRTNDGLNFSPLENISKDNVADLKVAWRARLREGMSMSMPLVHDGIMFVHSFPDTVLALDATNGEVLWRYQHASKSGSSQKMGLGLHGHKVLVPTSDLKVLALDARKGTLLWEHQITPEVKAQGAFGPIGGHQLRSAPLVAGDVVIQGVTASFASRGGFIVGLNVETGDEIWRFNTIARPGEPGGNTWNDVPLDKRSGGSVWHQGSYDPELNLVYYGVAPTYDTGPLLKPLGKEGVTNDALYTNCTIALNPETGELVWYYQHMQNDQWDLDWVFERQIATVPFRGEQRKVVMNVGKMAILEAVDAATGEYLFSVDPGTQNVITSIDKETGYKTFDPEKMPDPSKEAVICPSAAGGRSWPLTTFSPVTNYNYIPITEWCMLFSKEGSQLLTSGVGIGRADHRDGEDGKIGRLQAIDVAYQEPAWKYEQAAPFSTGLLATQSGLLFTGDMEPSIKAFDAKTGKVLWSAALDDNPSSSIITYTVGDQQYVALLVGIFNLHVAALEGFVGGSDQLLDTSSGGKGGGGAAIWVFSL